MTDSYTLAHLSDPHLTAPTGLSVAGLMNKRLLGYLSWRRKRRHRHRPDILRALTEDLAHTRPDHVAVTGDLVQIAWPSELEQARAWLAELGQPSYVSLVPGNHDTYVAVPDHRGLALWAPYMRGDDGARAFPYLRRRGPFSIVGLSSAYASPPLLATGRIGAAQIERLARLLDAEASRLRVVLVHHPPLAGTLNRRKSLIDDAQLTGVLAAHGVELVLHGHAHRSVRASLALEGGGAALVLGAPSASSSSLDSEECAGYYRIAAVAARDGAWSLRVHRHSYDAPARRFRATQVV